MAAPDDVLTLADLLRTTEVLRANNVEPLADGCYAVYLPPRAAEEVELDRLLVGADYRTWSTAWSLLGYERRREALGRRGHVTAAEVAERVSRL